MIKNANAQSTAINYFNAHTEGMGYLDSLELVNPKPGQNYAAFWSANFCMLEGNPLNPDKTYVSLKIPCEKALDELLPFANNINDPDTKVFVGLRLAEYRARPFQYGPESQNVGKLGVNYSAKLINVLHLKVGDQTIKLKRNEQATTTDFGVPAAGSVRNAQLVQDQANQEPVKRPFVVRLSQNEPNFEITKERLKGEGYRWAKDITAWVVPSVKLDKSHPQFQAMLSELKSLGYRWNKVNTSWDYEFSKIPQSAGQGGFRSTNQQFAQQRNYQQPH